MNKLSPREAVLEFLIQWEKEKAYSNLLVNQVLKKKNLSEKDRRLFTELAYGSIQRLNTLDWIIFKLVKKSSSLDLWVKHLLRIGLYQLVYLDKIPSRAVVYETVQVAKRRGHKGISSFVNGILRSFLRQKEKLLPSNPKTVEEKAIFYSHPKWVIERLEKTYGEEETTKILSANNTPAKLSVRVNFLKTNRESWIEKYKESEAGEVMASELCPEGVVIVKGGNLSQSVLFKEGACTFQDESSMLVARILNPHEGMNVLDACSAPGGKATHIAELMKNSGEILACDLYKHKMKLIQKNRDRLGTSIIQTKETDARELPNHVKGKFDAILIDAPCSGLGVIRRKPDIKWRKTKEDVDLLIKLQRELLNTVSKLLRPGGTFVYSTCTTEVKENQEQIFRFLEENNEFQFYPFQDELSSVVKEKAVLGKGWMQILPHHFDSDGFFIARLKKWM